MEINLSFAILLTTLAGLSTGIGSAIAFFIRTPKYSYLAVALGFSAGVMIYISFTELLGTAIGDVGFARANIAFFQDALQAAHINEVYLQGPLTGSIKTGRCVSLPQAQQLIGESTYSFPRLRALLAQVIG